MTRPSRTAAFEMPEKEHLADQRQPVRLEIATHVLGTDRYLCLRAVHMEIGGGERSILELGTRPRTAVRAFARPIGGMSEATAVRCGNWWSQGQPNSRFDLFPVDHSAYLSGRFQLDFFKLLLTPVAARFPPSLVFWWG